MSQLERTFAALGDTTRRAIVASLADGEMTLSKLAEPFDMSLTAVSKHVGVLEAAGVVDIEKRGRNRHCRLRGEALQEAAEWLDGYRNFWESQFDNLARHLGDERKSP